MTLGSIHSICVNTCLLLLHKVELCYFHGSCGTRNQCFLVIQPNLEVFLDTIKNEQFVRMCGERQFLEKEMQLLDWVVYRRCYMGISRTRIRDRSGKQESLTRVSYLQNLYIHKFPLVQCYGKLNMIRISTFIYPCYINGLQLALVYWYPIFYFFRVDLYPLVQPNSNFYICSYFNHNSRKQIFSNLELMALHTSQKYT